MARDSPLRFTSTMEASPPTDGSYYVVVAHLGGEGWTTLRLAADYSGGEWRLSPPAVPGDRVAGWLRADQTLIDQDLAAIPIDNLSL